MQRSSLNLLIDLTAAALFIAMAATGYILWFPLPPGTNKEFSLWGLLRHEWGAIHFWIAIALLTTILVHSCLHWNWLVTMIRQRMRLAKASHAVLLRMGVLTALALSVGFGVFAWAAHLGVQVQSNETCAVVSPVPIAQKAVAKINHTTWEDVSRIFARACLSCHGPSTQRAGFRVDRPEDFFASDHPLILPGDSKASRLIAIVEGDAGIRGHELPEVDVARLRAWIDAGAKTSVPVHSQ